MKLFLLLASVLTLTMAQRPSYAGSSPIGQPGLASRFKDTEDDSTNAPVVNRFGEDGGTTAKIPVDARGDSDLVNRLNQWPREHRPFWLLNAEQIESHRRPQGNGVQQGGTAQFASRNSFNEFDSDLETRTIKPQPSRSSFLGPLDD